MLIVDSHVHIHKCYDWASFLDAAYENFSNRARKVGCVDDFIGVLMLCEMAGVNEFEKLAEIANSDEATIAGNWSISHCEEGCSLMLTRTNSSRNNLSRNESDRMIIIAGRQIVTSEKLEVLALGTNQMFADGVPVNELLKSVQEAGAIPVIPWGVGKWLGHRGKVLSQVLEANKGKALCLGDNGGRPVFWQNLTHFKQARAVGIPIIPGSDPLPFPSETSRIGNFGFTLEGTISTTEPAHDLHRKLFDTNIEINPYGHLQGPIRFLQNQISIRLAKPNNSDESQ